MNTIICTDNRRNERELCLQEKTCSEAKHTHSISSPL